MDTEYALKITPAAAEDLENVYRYIKESFLAENTANRFIKEIADKLKLLKYFPYKYELSRDAGLKLRGYRRLVIKNYVALYLIDEGKKQVIVARIFYGPMDYTTHI